MKEKTMNKYEIAANVTLKGIEGQPVRMSAQEQREVFGAAVFGRFEICIDLNGQGKVTGRKNAGHGNICRDSIFNEWTLEEIAEAAKSGRKLRCD